MPRAFNKREQEEIRDRLRDAGAILFRNKGIAKTTVDDCVRGTGISKGSFYKFYGSKELLFFEILEDVHEGLRAPLLEISPAGKAHSAKVFKSMIRRLLEQVCEEPLIQLMGRPEELHGVKLRVPPERLMEHEQKDQEFLDALIQTWGDKNDKPNRDVVAARMTAAVLICLRRDFFGERLFALALDAAVDSIVACFFNLEHTAGD